MSQLKLYGYIALVIAVLGAFYGTYRYGYNEAEEAAKVIRLQEVEELQERNLIINKQLSDVSMSLAETKAKIVYKDKIIVKEVVTYVQDPNRTICTYDDEWLRIKQSIIDNADTRK